MNARESPCPVRWAVHAEGPVDKFLCEQIGVADHRSIHNYDDAGANGAPPGSDHAARRSPACRCARTPTAARIDCIAWRGSRPVMGSSTIRICGSATMARASMARANSPPDRVVAAWSRLSIRSHCSSARVMAGWKLCGNPPVAGSLRRQPQRHQPLHRDRPFQHAGSAADRRGAPPAAGGQGGQGFAVQHHPACVGLQQSRQHFQQGGLAGAIGAQHGDELPGMGLDRNIAQDGLATRASP